MNTYFAKPPMPRHQLVLIPTALDDVLLPDDPLRVLEAIFERLDWSRYEAVYDGQHGQPPIHPRYVASAIFYGLIKGLRSSRQIEDATRMRVDFMWLLERQTLDHATVCKFRLRFGDALKDTFRQVNREGLKHLGERLAELSIDGTRVRANSARQGARTATWLEQQLAALQTQLEQALQEMATQDARDAAATSSTPPTADEPVELAAASATELEHRLTELQERRRRYEAALAVARERDAAKRDKEGQAATAVRVPLSDPDALILPNKEGGYAPNYTPVAAVDSGTGLIVATEVLADSAEATAVTPLLTQVQADLGQTPARVLCDSGFASGRNQEALADQGIAMYTPVATPVPGAHPAFREDPSQPLPAERLAQLPRVGPDRKFDHHAFLFDAARNCYWCPLGRALVAHREQSRNTKDGKVLYTEYQSRDCAGCPHAGSCLSRGATRRIVNRDQYEYAREHTARRMATADGKAIYRRRAPKIEGTFGTLKAVLGIRAFLLRGLSKVRVEWLWTCTAYNLKKLVRLLCAGPAAQVA